MKDSTRISEVEKLDNGIIKIVFKDNDKMNPTDLDELYELAQDLVDSDGKALFLNIFPNYLGGDIALAKASASHKINELRRGQAIVINNLPQRLQLNFYKKYHRLQHPFKIFNSEDKATKWLLSLELYETSISRVQRLDGDVLKITLKENIIVQPKGLLENLELYKKLIPDGGYFLNIFRESNTADRNVKLPFEASDRIKLKKGEAFVVSNLANRIELEYYINKTKQLYPTKVFENEEDAMDWIEAIKEA